MAMMGLPAELIAANAIVFATARVRESSVQRKLDDEGVGKLRLRMNGRGGGTTHAKGSPLAARVIDWK